MPHIDRLLTDVSTGRATFLRRTMVQARTDDGQVLTALNEIYVGQPTHQSARYTLDVAGRVERQSSSGIIVGSGTGSTGWCLSLQRAQARHLQLPKPADQTLVWFVREPWPSPSTGASLTNGTVHGDALGVHNESDTLVAFGDGIEDDRLILSWGQHLTLEAADRHLATVQ